MTGYKERCDAAANLRDEASCMLHDGGIGDLNAILDACNIPADAAPEEAFLHLADLIEPEPERTARMEYDEVHCDYVCTACGERTPTGVYEAVADDDRLLLKPMGFCPACGARLVD